MLVEREVARQDERRVPSTRSTPPTSPLAHHPENLRPRGRPLTAATCEPTQDCSHDPIIDPMAAGAIDDRPRIRNTPAGGRLFRPTRPTPLDDTTRGASNNMPQPAATSGRLVGRVHVRPGRRERIGSVVVRALDARHAPLRCFGIGSLLRVRFREVVGPIVHEPTPTLEQVRAGVGRLHLVLDHMRQRRLDDLARMVRLLGREALSAHPPHPA